MPPLLPASRPTAGSDAGSSLSPRLRAVGAASTPHRLNTGRSRRTPRTPIKNWLRTPMRSLGTASFTGRRQSFSGRSHHETTERILPAPSGSATAQWHSRLRRPSTVGT